MNYKCVLLLLLLSIAQHFFETDQLFCVLYDVVLQELEHWEDLYHIQNLLDISKYKEKKTLGYNNS